METGRVGERKVGEPSRIRSKRPATDTNDDPVDPVDGLFRTDATIPALAQLRELREVEMWDTKITPAGVRKLQAALPECYINIESQKRQPPK